ncbi:MAG: hypothetical protein QG670_1504 [Thermoproteota archaeon]|nr:hypothetical protein [Thermoproteota archaeon]
MSREEILKLLNDPKNGQYYKNILELCKTPITPADLMKNFSSRRGRFTFIGQDAFNALLNLKKQGAVDFIDGKYVTTQLGQSLMT